MSDRVLLTGISGFLGGHVALALLKAGFAVRGSLRDAARAPRVRESLRAAGADVSRLEFVALDLRRDDGWRAAARGLPLPAARRLPAPARMPRDREETDPPRRRRHAPRARGGARRGGRADRPHLLDRRHHVRPSARARRAVHRGRLVAHRRRAAPPPTPRVKTRAELEAWSIMDEAGRRDDLATINPAVILGPLLDDDPGTSACWCATPARRLDPGCWRASMSASSTSATSRRCT